MKKRTYHSKSSRLALMSKHQSSGLGLEEFCVQEGLNVQTYKYWLYQADQDSKESKQQAPKRNSRKGNAFVELSGVAAGRWRLNEGIELHFKNGLRLCLPRDYGVENLLLLLKAIPC